jgi:hypothetical protein
MDETKKSKLIKAQDVYVAAGVLLNSDAYVTNTPARGACVVSNVTCVKRYTDGLAR